MVDNVLIYRSDNLIIFYCCRYSELSDIIGVVIWNFMKLMRNTEFGS